MTLLEKDASPEELEQCLRDGHDKMGVLNKDIRALRAEKTSLDEMLERKLVRKTDEAETQQDDNARYESTSPPTNPHLSEEQPTPNNQNWADEENKGGDDLTTPEEEEEQEIHVPATPNVVESNQEDDFVVLTPPTRTDSGSE